MAKPKRRIAGVTRIQEFGASRSLCVCIPRDIAEKLGLRKGVSLRWAVSGRTLVAEPVKLSEL